VPKSRGRRPSARKQERRPQTTWQQDVVSLAKALLVEDVSRTTAELLASDVLGEVQAARRDVTEDDLVDVAVRELTAYATRKRTRPAAALVAALGTVVDDAAVAAALDGWARALVADLPWVSEPPAVLRRASAATDVYDDERITFLEYDDVVVVVQSSRGMGDAVTTVQATRPGVTAAWDETEDWPRADVDVTAEVARLLSALEVTEAWWPPHDDAEYLQHRALLAARLQATGVEPPEPEEREPIGDHERERLLDRFFAESGEPDDAVRRRLAGLCLDHADRTVRGGALAWSPTVVERFLLDRAPAADLDEGERRLLPAVTAAFVRWALTSRGLDPRVAEDAAAVALEGY